LESEFLFERDDLRKLGKDKIEEILGFGEEKPESTEYIKPDSLAERIVRQFQIEEFMVGAQCLWENFTGGSTRERKKFKGE
jgi:hypothetical protein